MAKRYRFRNPCPNPVEEQTIFEIFEWIFQPGELQRVSFWLCNTRDFARDK